MDVASVWQKVVFVIVHHTSIWLLAGYFVTALAAWYLAYVLDQHNNRKREANLARKTALAYTVIGFSLWLFSFVMS